MIKTCNNILIKLEKDLSLLRSFKDFILIDFGAGDGTVLKHFSMLFKSTIGIDIDPQDSSVIKMDMIDYKFDDVPTVLYMYDPLYDSDTAETIYNTVLDNFNKITETKYLIAYMDKNTQFINNWCKKNGFRRKYSSSSYQIFRGTDNS